MSEQKPIELGPPATAADILPSNETDPNDNPRVFFASTNEFGAGRVHGIWMEAAQEVSALEQGIESMLRAASDPEADGYCIYRSENFGDLPIAEAKGLETVVRIARGLVAGGPAFQAWAKVVGLEQASAEEFRAHHLGSWRTPAQFGGEFARELGLGHCLETVPPTLAPYIRFDCRGFVADLIARGEIITEHDDEGVHIFLTPGTA